MLLISCCNRRILIGNLKRTINRVIAPAYSSTPFATIPHPSAQVFRRSALYKTSKMAVTTICTKDFCKELYPDIEPYDKGFLKVSDIHELYYEQSGNPNGNPVVFLHGGPGGGTSPRDRRYFDPQAYRIVVFDQRGSGQSRPSAELKDNTTWDLVEDIERLRKKLGIDKWVVFGGSWGSTLALAYAETHPAQVKGLILRGIFMLRRAELLWFYQEGASWLFPDYWEEFLAPIPEVERADLISAYYRRLTGNNEEDKLRCAKAWSKWEMATARLFCDDDMVKKVEEDIFALQFARIECHYFVHGGFFKSDDQILKDVDKIAKHNIPCMVVQGRYDVVCPIKSAWDLYRRWPQVQLHIVADAGHSAKEDAICSKLVAFADAFKTL
ncbi:probable proline iminopeptidase [Paramacrobiotus metropolitanus]|uniref:probable proline iminopeptidase n=1 Tax=Paramacrobiotus metropolitanus TaxID=2943436 RepID=UPI0024460289|nr:probable proline iminopeptidase [Paramacrobiotus metropolitanus]